MKTVTKKMADKSKNEGGNRKRQVLLALLLLLVIYGVAGAFRSNPVDEVRQLRAQMTNKDNELSPEERKELGKKIRDQLKELTPDQRREFMKDRQKEKSADLTRFFELTPEEQRQELDKKIDQMITRINKRSQDGSGNGGLGGGGPGGFGQGPPGANGDNPGGPMADGPGFKKLSPEEREERRQNRLDFTTPDFRAQMYQFRQMMNDRLNDRGVQLPAFGPRKI